MYASRARQYDHTDVILFILPANDFSDNDPGEFPSNVYRPYLRPRGEGYEVYYTVPWERRFVDARRLSTVLKNGFDNTFDLANVLRWAVARLKDGFSAQQMAVEGGYYDRHVTGGLTVMFYALDQLVRAAGERRVYLLTIPDRERLLRGPPRGRGELPG